MAYKIRIPKKKEIAPTQIESRSEKMIGHLLDNPKLIFGGVVLVLLVSGLVVGKQFSDKRSGEAAWLIEAEASRLFHDPAPLPEPVEEGEEDTQEVLLDPVERLKKASELYDEIIKKYPESDVAAVALFESGNVYYKLEDYDEAEQRLNSFIEKYGSKKGLVTISRLKLGYLNQARGNDGNALSHFRTVYEMPDSSSRYHAGFELARALEAGGKMDEANVIYTDISENATESPWGAEAKARLLLLNPPSDSSLSKDTEDVVDQESEKEATE